MNEVRRPWIIAVRPGLMMIETIGLTDDDLIEWLSDNHGCFYSHRKFSYADIDWHEDHYNCRINTDAYDHNQPVAFDVYELPNVLTSDMEQLQNWWQKLEPRPEPIRTLALYKMEQR